MQAARRLSDRHRSGLFGAQACADSLSIRRFVTAACVESKVAAGSGRSGRPPGVSHWLFVAVAAVAAHRTEQWLACDAVCVDEAHRLKQDCIKHVACVRCVNLAYGAAAARSNASVRMVTWQPGMQTCCKSAKPTTAIG